MNPFCGFGDPAICDLVDAFAIVGGISGFMALVAVLAVALGNIRASQFSKPVVDAQNQRIEDLERKLADDLSKTASQEERLRLLREEVTQRAAVDKLAADAQTYTATVMSGLGEIQHAIQQMAKETAQYRAAEVEARERGRKDSAEEHRALLNALEFITTRFGVPAKR